MLDDDLYAALLLVVLVTTLVTPQLLKMRYARLGRAPAISSIPLPNAPAPSGEWLRVALDAAVGAAHAPPSPELVDWLSAVSSTPIHWDRKATDALMRVLKQGNARSWRFLEIVGALDKALPELAEALRSRQADPLLLDPMSTHRWATVERLRSIREGDILHEEFTKLAQPELLLLGALLDRRTRGSEGAGHARPPDRAPARSRRLRSKRSRC